MKPVSWKVDFSFKRKSGGWKIVSIKRIDRKKITLLRTTIEPIFNDTESSEFKKNFLNQWSLVNSTKTQWWSHKNYDLLIETTLFFHRKSVARMWDLSVIALCFYVVPVFIIKALNNQTFQIKEKIHNI